MGSLNLSCPNLVLITLKSVHPGLKPGLSRLSLLKTDALFVVATGTDKLCSCEVFYPKSGDMVLLQTG